MTNDVNKIDEFSTICLRVAEDVITAEIEAIKLLKNNFNAQFVKICHLLVSCKGKVILSGVGKSGHIAAKIAATLASTGTPAFFMQPNEALHGDFGAIEKNDVLIAISFSGESYELLSLLPFINKLDIPLIAITGNENSSLSQAGNYSLTVTIEKEACSLGLAPTASTTATLALGDAIAMAVSKLKKFTAQDFALSHPGGALGRRLSLLVKDIMLTDTDMPIVNKKHKLLTAILEISAKKMGFAVVINSHDKIEGIFTDGDLRRVLNSHAHELDSLIIEQVMTKNCVTVDKDLLAYKALEVMHEHKCNGLPVTNAEKKLIGVIGMHTILQAKVV